MFTRAAGNRVLAHMLKYVDKRIHFVRLADITNPERLKTTCLDHLAILEAIRERRAAGAADAVRRNIEWGRTNVETALKDALLRAYTRDGDAAAAPRATRRKGAAGG